MKVNLHAEVSKEDINYFFTEYKSLAAPVLSLVAAVLLFLFVLVPQIFSFSSKKSTADSENQKLSQLKEAQNLATSEDVVTLSSNLSLASQILPSSKDFQAIINAISLAADETNITIQNYEFTNSGASTSLSSFPSIVFTLSLSSDPSQTINFIQNLYKVAPISEVTSISGSDSSSNLTIAFYYKPFAPVSDATNVAVRKTNQKEQNVLNVVGGWNVSSGSENSLPSSSESAQETNSPF